MRSPEIDKSLWFMHLGCVGRHYLLGNPHTVPGRMWAWCPKERCTHFISRADIGKTSKVAAYWVEGYLRGGEPAPPAGQDGPPDHESAAYKSWRGKVRRYHQSGHWPQSRARRG